MTDFESATSYIDELTVRAVKNEASNTVKILRTLGIDPLGELPFSVAHIAGTNGKGSTAVFLESILLRDGRNTGCFISPHLVSMCERIRIRGEDISEEDFCRAFCRVREAVEMTDCLLPSYFEFLFIMAVVAFSEAGVSDIILETGLGGTRDVTNVFAKPAVSVITPIGMDHMQFLGEDLRSIAAHKAGIIKRNVMVVFADREDETALVIREKAHEMGALVFPIREKDAVVESFDTRSLCFSGEFMGRKETFTVNRQALYQKDNALLAVTASQVLGVKSTKAVREGLLEAKWPGRFEEIREDLFVDGGHNEPAILGFLKAVRDLRSFRGNSGRNILIYGAAKDKNYLKIGELLSGEGLFAQILLVRYDDYRSEEPSKLREGFQERDGVEIREFSEPSEALFGALNNRRPGDVIFVTGSLYLVGTVRELLERNSL